ncbi:MAG TPA: chemotaxis protein CheB [Candidatus Krumholzibacteria bacterium]
MAAPEKGKPRAPRTSGKRAPAPPKASESAPKQLGAGPVPTESVAARAPDTGLLIVGVGGSAGSLSPLREFLAAIPADCGIAFVIVSHQAPTGHSLLPEILAKCTKMPVREIGEENRAEPNHVYVEPRGHSVVIRGGMLSLEPVALRGGSHLPIDLFFRALARDQGGHAAGIVLSGTGTDGTLGLAAIRAASGLSLVQDPATAEFDGMPVSAIHARAADFVLSPAEMPGRLLAHRKGLVSLARADAAPELADNEIQRILAVMRERGGHDFSEYKHETLARRIERRMQLHGIAGLEQYARFLDESGAEIDALWHDWLIGVSSFFRDPVVFQALESALLELLAGREDGSPLRIWVPGCATGEEAYSLVIVLLEILKRLEKHLEVQVFATDLNPAAIQVARAARYPEGIAADVSEERLARFFEREDEFHRVKKELRDLVVFAVQDALHDPPFTRVDLVSCRNLLIYVEPSAQGRLIRSFHYSLNPRGLLLLGSAESTTGSEEFFSPLDGHFKIFRRNDATAPQPTLRWPAAHRANRGAADGAHPVEKKADLASPLRRVLAERFGPPAVLVDEAGQIQQVHGRVGAYLELPAGRVNVNIVDMAREGLRAPLASALREASETDGRVAERNVRVHVEGDRLALHLKVVRVHEPSHVARLFLVSFEPAERGPRKRARKSEPTAGARGTRREAQMETELRTTRYDLQGSIDELRAANEELASSNEEAQSANEELQSTNEELQTAKEEAQSLNEELHTVNAELTQKLETFERATDDLLNLMSNIEVATIFLDDQLRVKRFTPQARSVAHLIDSDIGRPLADLATILDYPALLSDAASVIKSLHASETQAAARDGNWYLVRIRPYRTARNTVDGVVITFFDITEAQRTERLQAARSLAESIVDAVREPFLVLDGGLRVVRANRAYYQAFRVEPEQTDGRLIGELGSHQWVIPALHERLEKALQEGTGFDDFEVESEFPHLGRRRLLLNARPLSPKDGAAAELVLLGIQELRAQQAEASRPEVTRR